MLSSTSLAARPAISLELGLPSDGSKPTETTQRKAYDLLAEGMGAGFNGPLVVLVDARNSAGPAPTQFGQTGTWASLR